MPYTYIPPTWTGTLTNTTTGFGTFVPPNYIQIGNGFLIEREGELVWQRPDGSEVVLTGKGAGFKKLYDKLDESA